MRKKGERTHPEPPARPALVSGRTAAAPRHPRPWASRGPLPPAASRQGARQGVAGGLRGWHASAFAEGSAYAQSRAERSGAKPLAALHHRAHPLACGVAWPAIKGIQRERGGAGGGPTAAKSGSSCFSLAAQSSASSSVSSLASRWACRWRVEGRQCGENRVENSVEEVGCMLGGLGCTRLGTGEDWGGRSGAGARPAQAGARGCAAFAGFPLRLIPRLQRSQAKATVEARPQGPRARAGRGAAAPGQGQVRGRAVVLPAVGGESRPTTTVPARVPALTCCFCSSSLNSASVMVWEGNPALAALARTAATSSSLGAAHQRGRCIQARRGQ